MKARVRATELFFDVDGAALRPAGSQVRERPTAFLVHGGPGSDHVGFKGSCAALTQSMQLVYFDQRGHGRSARGDPRLYRLDENVEDMEALRRYLGLGSVVSIGYSYGGTVAMAHAARYPSAVSHLILVSTVAHGGYVGRAKELVRQLGNAEQIRACDDLFCGRLDTPEKMRRYYETMGPLYMRSYDASAFELALDRAIFSPDALNRAHGPEGFLRSLDVRAELGSITAATLILAGRHDWICPPEFSRELHDLIPGSQLRICEGSSHSIMNDEPQVFLAAVSEFVVHAGDHAGE